MTPEQRRRAEQRHERTLNAPDANKRKKLEAKADALLATPIPEKEIKRRVKAKNRYERSLASNHWSLTK